MLVPLILFNNDNQLSKDLAWFINYYYPSRDPLYYTHLLLNFSKSFLILILCYFAIMATNSKRLAYGLLIFICASMSMDLLSMMSSDIYYFIKPYRYEITYNFKDVYVSFEICCLLYSIINWTLDYIKARFDRYSDSHDAVCDSFITEISGTCKKKAAKRERKV